MSILKRDYEQPPAVQESLFDMTKRLGFLSLQIFLLLMLSTFPFKFLNFADVRPAFVLMAVYYWAIFRPQALSPLAAFVTGLLLDLLYASPLGLNALTFVLLQWLTKTQRKFLSRQSFIILWLCFFMLETGVFIFQWAMFSLFDWSLMSVRPLLISAALTGFFFPPMVWVFNAFGRSMARE